MLNRAELAARCPRQLAASAVLRALVAQAAVRLRHPTTALGLHVLAAASHRRSRRVDSVRPMASGPGQIRPRAIATHLTKQDGSRRAPAAEKEAISDRDAPASD